MIINYFFTYLELRCVNIYGKHAGSVQALFSYALIYYIMQ